jgi:hypothetical protein
MTTQPTSKETSATSAPSTELQAQHATVSTSIEKLTEAFNAKDPLMPNHLAEIHRLLLSYSDVVSLLTDSQIHELIQAAERYMQTEIVKGKTPSKGRGKNLDLDDF